MVVLKLDTKKYDFINKFYYTNHYFYFDIFNLKIGLFVSVVNNFRILTIRCHEFINNNCIPVLKICG